MTPDSFSFGKFNSVDNWGIRVITYDVFLPPKRERKITIPRRSGMYKFSGDVWDERTIRIECTLEKKITRSELREIFFELSKNSALRLWEEPEKYYLAEIYSPGEILDYYDEQIREFELSFVCFPFAFGETTTTKLKVGNNKIVYSGTADSPCVIVLKNTGPYTARNVFLRSTYRR